MTQPTSVLCFRLVHGKSEKEFRLHHERMASGIKIILTRDYLVITMTLR